MELGRRVVDGRMKCKSARKNVGQRQVVLIIYLYDWRGAVGNVPLKQTRLGVIRQGRASLELNSLGIQITACTVGDWLPPLPLRPPFPSPCPSSCAPPLFSFAGASVAYVGMRRSRCAYAVESEQTVARQNRVGGVWYSGGGLTVRCKDAPRWLKSLETVCSRNFLCF